MTNQAENETQASMTPEEVRQQLLAEMEASQQVITELSDEALEEISGGSLSNRIHNVGAFTKGMYQGWRDKGRGRISSALTVFDAVPQGWRQSDQKASSQEVRRLYNTVVDVSTIK